MSKNIPILSMDDPDFTDKLLALLGVKSGDTLVFHRPQFERDDEIVPATPTDMWHRLHLLYAETLRAIGCRAWDEPNERGEQLWLFPAEWYPHIPNGLRITSINGKQKTFQRGQTDSDKRFGVLAYGVVINVNEQPSKE